MVDATDFQTPEPAIGDVAVTIMKNDVAFAALTGGPAVAELSNGWYKIVVPAADMVASVILKATGTGCAELTEKIEPGIWVDELLGDRVIDDSDGTVSVKQSDGATESHVWTPTEPSATTSKLART